MKVRRFAPGFIFTLGFGASGNLGPTEITLPPTFPWVSDGLGCGDNGC